MAPSITAPPFSGLPTPGSTAAASTYAVSSNPSGLTVILDGANIGVTPTSVTPKSTFNPSITGGGAPQASQLTIQPGIVGAANFTITFNQLRNGAQQVFYNRILDTQGSISGNYTSIVRAQSLAQGPADAVRRPVVTDIRSRPSIDTTKLFVKYKMSALQSSGRVARNIENAEGFDGGNDIIATDGTLTRVLQIPSGQTYESVAAKLLRHSEVVKVDHVHLRYPLGSPVIPNDPHFQLQNQQWDMFQIGMPQAWSYPPQGNGVTIAVLDTGYDNTAKDFSRVSQAFTFLNGAAPTAGAIDTDGHGSNTAGIADAAVNNGCGFAGIGYNAGLMILKIIANNGSISTADEANAIKFATDNGARVISLSIGGAQVDAAGTIGYDDTEFAAVSYALSHNVVVVAAAGNESQPYVPNHSPSCNSSLPACGVTNLDYPGAYPGVIAVGASAYCENAPNNPNHEACFTNGSGAYEYVASYSNGGPGLALVAPGGDPTGSTDGDNFHWIDNLSSPLNTQFKCNRTIQTSNPDGVCSGQFAGTSQATPHVAGAAALVLALKPGMTPAQVAQLLEDTTDNLSGVDPSYQGHGRLNVARALAKLAGDSSFPAYRPAFNQFVAFAYTNSGATGVAPAMINVYYKNGVPVNADGTFRIADINPSGAYKIGVWYDANGNGVVDAGDYFAATGACSTSAPCSATGLVPSVLTSSVIP